MSLAPLAPFLDFARNDKRELSSHARGADLHARGAVCSQLGSRHWFFRPVIARINTPIVSGAINLDPISPMNAVRILERRTRGKCGSYLDPAILLSANHPDFIRDFGQILILTQDQGDIENSTMRKTDNVYRDANIHSLFRTNEECVRFAAGQPNGLIAITQRARENGDLVPTHLGEFGCPKMIPKSIIRRVRDTGVKSDLAELPSLLLTDSRCEREDVVVWKRIAEGNLCGVEEILAVDEYNRPFDGGFSGHGASSEKNNPV